MEELLKELKIAIWCFYHEHRGTINHVESKKRIYAIADKLQSEYGLSNDELIAICNDSMYDSTKTKGEGAYEE